MLFGNSKSNINGMDKLPVPGKLSILIGHFLKRLYNFELVATDADSRNTIVQILVLSSLPGQFLPFWYFFPPADMLAAFLRHQVRVFLGFEYYFICFSMIITGLVTVLNWDSLFPDRRDHAVLSPLPLHARTIFGSKLAALLIFQLSFTVAINLSSTFLFPYFASVRMGGEVSTLSWVGIHAISILAGNLLMLLSQMCIQGVLLFASARLFSTLSLIVQFGFFVLLLSGLLMLPDMETHLAAFCQGHAQWMRYLPPTWILGLYESLMGRAPLPLALLAPWAVWALVGTVAGASFFYCFSYQRHLRNIIPSTPQPLLAAWTLPSMVWNAFCRFFFRQSRQRAVFEFIGKTLLRSRLHQLYLLGYLGAGLSFLLAQILNLWLTEGWRGFQNSPLTLRAIPLGFTFFVLVGLRMIYALPAELPANWIFQMTGKIDSRFGIIAARSALLWQALVPVQLLFFSLTWILLNFKEALLQGIFNLTIAFFLMEWLIRYFDRIPFTAAYQPGKARIHLMWPVYWAGFYVHSFFLALWEGYLLEKPLVLLVFCALLLGGAIWMRRQARGGKRTQRNLVFDDSADPYLQMLNLDY